MVRYKAISLPVMAYPSLMNCSRYRRIPFHICKLFAECAADFLCRVLSALGKCKILFSGTFPVPSGQLKTITFTKTVNDVFQLFSCFVQKRDVLWITDVCRCAGCIKGQRSFVCILFCSIDITGFSSRWRSMVIFVIILVSKKILVYFHQHLC